MITAELTHNPYVSRTTARFNGREPKVNSAIEKFEGRPLVDWAYEIPTTFHDEMNGFDFDFYFSGTDADYEKVLEAFACQGVKVVDATIDNVEAAAKSETAPSVRIVHVGHLEDVDTKRQELLDFLGWLDTHRNRWFDYDEFLNENDDSLDGSSPFIIVSNRPVQVELPNVSVESVESTRGPLDNTVLENTPILFTVDAKNKGRFRKELQTVLKRDGVKQNQLFFLIHPALDRERASRVISDLGVYKPQIVETADSALIKKYIDDYPSMCYVRTALRLLRGVSNDVRGMLEKVDIDSEEKSNDTRTEIIAIDSEIEGYKNARASIGDECAIDSNGLIAEYCTQFSNQILTWRNRKTKMTGSEQIQAAAREYAYDLGDWTRTLDANIVSTMRSSAHRIERVLAQRYESAGRVTVFIPDVEAPGFRSVLHLPDIVKALTSQTATEQAMPKNDLFGLFGHGGNSDAEATYVEVASYDVWRYTAQGILLPVVLEAKKIYENELSRYQASLVESYTKQLDSLIEKKLEEKSRLASTLTDVERLLEEDRDWLSEFERRLLAIERS